MSTGPRDRLPLVLHVHSTAQVSGYHSVDSPSFGNGMAPSITATLAKVAFTVASATALGVGLVAASPLLLYALITGDDPSILRKQPTYVDPKPLSAERIDLSKRPYAPQPADSPFFALPRELRDRIYAEALGGRRVWLWLVDDPAQKRRYVRSGSIPRSADHILIEAATPDPLCISLLSTCRQIHLEAHPILLSSNTFAFDADGLRATLLAGLGAWNLPLLRAVCINFNAFPQNRWFFDHPDFWSFDLLRDMERLRCLEFQFNQASWKEYDPAAVLVRRYDPRDLRASAWGELVCDGLRRLEEFRMAFTWSRVVMDIKCQPDGGPDLALPCVIRMLVLSLFAQQVLSYLAKEIVWSSPLTTYLTAYLRSSTSPMDEW
ncbi:hypothetical protein HMN09_01125800 [Mycena chlorophos]|uniref:DUF7730 domain-containing protein n=1 Tax=Mycena chlorophos TaxID=658473 RepID=A0A8H6SBQ7_MYCCL|nr:hypothetical protein HMN09_01125800 [Mycena chlorophos]